MSDVTTGVLGFGVLLVLLAIRMPVGTAMLAVGAGGIYILHPRGEVAVFATLAGESFSVSSLFSLTILPLFVLMGNLSGVSGMSRNLYNAAQAWFGHRKGVLASSTTVGCAGFSALSGSSLASAVTMGRIAIPEMKRFHYSNALSTGAVAAGGTLGILIPPSAGFVVYAILTEESIGRLFMAGALPGLILMALFIAANSLQVRCKRELAPDALAKAPRREPWQALPLLQPLFEGYGFEMIWFGVLLVIVLEMGLISPPVGINVFIVNGIAQDVPMNTIFRGIWPFWFAMGIMIILLVTFPQIALLLPNTMFGP